MCEGRWDGGKPPVLRRSWLCCWDFAQPISAQLRGRGSNGSLDYPCLSSGPASPSPTGQPCCEHSSTCSAKRRIKSWQSRLLGEIPSRLLQGRCAPWAGFWPARRSILHPSAAPPSLNPSDSLLVKDSFFSQHLQCLSPPYAAVY